ncbi:hypothetical protein [Ruegeria arenilitoris]|uniref:hypothetical protein n=1 Tax=Ruegeria arenilitoris TaxID=1173585 RepID=UPI00147CD710|nr:hypothetical protein [Ruegeria arenilitoris]
MKDNNWGLFKVEPQETGKPSKKPFCITDKTVKGVKDAFTHSLDEALAALTDGFELGYIPREGSQYVGIDMDNALFDDVELPWADELLGDSSCPYAATSSGLGLRVLMPRGEGDTELGGAGERNDVGFFATDSRGFTVPRALFADIQNGELVRDTALRDRVIARRGIANEKPHNHEDFLAKWDGHWFPHLNDQKACVEDMLSYSYH